MSTIPRCPFCESTVVGEAVELWDGKSYCRRCVERISPALLELAQRGESLVDIIPREAVSFWKYWFLIARLVSSIAVTLITLCAAAGIIIYNNVLISILTSLIVLAGMFLLLTVLSILPLLGYLIFRNDAPRLITIDRGGLRIVDNREDRHVDLSQCAWREGESFDDNMANLVGLHRGLLIQTNEEGFMLGYSPGNVILFRALLTLARVPRRSRVGHFQFALAVGVHGFTGMLAGLLVGWIVARLTNDAAWQSEIALLGTFNGCISGMAFSRIQTEHIDQTHKFRRPVRMAISFALKGLLIGILAGFLTRQGWSISLALINALINGLFGAGLAWICIRRTPPMLKAEQGGRPLSFD